MWTESLLFHTLPRPVGQFLENHWLPLMGECAMHARPAHERAGAVTYLEHRCADGINTFLGGRVVGRWLADTTLSLHRRQQSYASFCASPVACSLALALRPTFIVRVYAS